MPKLRSKPETSAVKAPLPLGENDRSPSPEPFLPRLMLPLMLEGAAALPR